MNQISLIKIFLFIICCSYSVNSVSQDIIKKEFIPKSYHFGQYLSLKVDYVFFDSLKIEKRTYFTKSYKKYLLFKLETFKYEKDSMIKHGKHIEYDTNSVMHISYNYFNGRLEGESKMYYNNGNIKYIFNYVNGIAMGNEFSYYKNGNIEYKGRYDNGYKVGLWKFYYDNGVLQAEGELQKKISNDTLSFRFFNDSCGINYFSPMLTEIIGLYRRMGQPKIGVWHFYNCDGELLRKYLFNEDNTYKILKKNNF